MSSLCRLLLFRHGAVGTAPCHPRASPSWRPPSLPVFALNKGPRSPGSHPVAPAAAGVPGLSQLPSPAPPPALDSLPAPLCRGSSGPCTPSWGCRHEPVAWELFQRMDPSPSPRDGSRGWILQPQHGAVGTCLLHGHVSPSQPGSSTQHPMAQPAPGALPAPAPNPPWSPLLHGGGGAPLGAPQLPAQLQPHIPYSLLGQLLRDPPPGVPDPKDAPHRRGNHAEPSLPCAGPK